MKIDDRDSLITVCDFKTVLKQRTYVNLSKSLVKYENNGYKP